MWIFDQGHSYEQLSLMPQRNMTTNIVAQQGSQRQEQTERLYCRESDVAKPAAVKMFDALHSFKDTVVLLYRCGSLVNCFQ